MDICLNARADCVFASGVVSGVFVLYKTMQYIHDMLFMRCCIKRRQTIYVLPNGTLTNRKIKI